MSRSPRWECSDDDLLVAMFCNDRPFSLMGERLRRSKDACERRLETLHRLGKIDLAALRKERQETRLSRKAGLSAHANGNGNMDRGAAIAGLRQLQRQQSLAAAVEYLTQVKRLRIEEKHGGKAYWLDDRKVTVDSVFHAAYELQPVEMV